MDVVLRKNESGALYYSLSMILQDDGKGYNQSKKENRYSDKNQVFGIDTGILVTEHQ
jgi:hypothetical protein